MYLLVIRRHSICITFVSLSLVLLGVLMSCADGERVQIPPELRDAQAECAAITNRSVLGTQIVVKRVMPLPKGFVGNITYDPETRRVWLISMGRPANTTGPSKIYEIDLESGEVHREVDLPFVGELGPAVYMDGFLYQGVWHESKLYKVAVNDSANFGRVVASVNLPTFLDLDLQQTEVLRFPFLVFKGASLTAEKRLLIHVHDIGELITIDQYTGNISKRVKTLRSLRGITAVPGLGGQELILANTDPSDARRRFEQREFMFRGIHGTVPLFPECFRPGERSIQWVLLDGSTGSLLSQSDLYLSRMAAGSVALVKHEAVEGTPYGRLTFLTIGEDGLLILEWEPSGRTSF